MNFIALGECARMQCYMFAAPCLQLFLEVKDVAGRVRGVRVSTSKLHMHCVCRACSADVLF